jgi:hypothetical protein
LSAANSSRPAPAQPYWLASPPSQGDVLSLIAHGAHAVLMICPASCSRPASPGAAPQEEMNLDCHPSALCLLTLNVQGLTPTKLYSALRWLRDKRVHDAILTETHLTTDPADILKGLAGGATKIFYVPSTGHTEGVCIVLGPGFHLSQPSSFVHPMIHMGRPCPSCGPHHLRQTGLPHWGLRPGPDQPAGVLL